MQTKQARGRTIAPTPKASICADGLVPPWPDGGEFLGIKRTKMYELMQDGSIPYVRVAGDRKIPRRALIEYAERNLVSRDCGGK
jgi:excisionase family DNA binding protein